MARTWTIQTQSTEYEDWTTDDLSSMNSRAERDAWSMSALSPNASGASRVFNWINWAPDDLLFTPEDLDDVPPEELQADADEWTIVSEAN